MNVNESKLESILDILGEQYKESENKEKIDFWIPLTKLIFESIEIRDKKGFSQSDVADLMRTRQSVISRLENMGRIPNYKFLSRLAIALGHPLGTTFYGDFMAVVPEKNQEKIKELAVIENISTQDFTQKLLERAVESVASCGDELEYTVGDSTYKNLLNMTSIADPDTESVSVGNSKNIDAGLYDSTPYVKPDDYLLTA